MTRVGTCSPRSATKSKPPAPTSGSSSRAQYCRISGSSAPIRRGVNIRESRDRWIPWTGGSSKINVPGGISKSPFRRSSVTPLREMNVSRFSRVRSMSSNRLSA